MQKTTKLPKHYTNLYHGNHDYVLCIILYLCVLIEIPQVQPSNAIHGSKQSWVDW